MRPSLIYETLTQDNGLIGLGITQDRVLESQSIDTRPFNTGLFLTVSFEETEFTPAIRRGPVVMTLAAHIPWTDGRDYTDIHQALNYAQRAFYFVENQAGGDGVRVTDLRPQGRGGNAVDEGWETITKTATYGVLYDESPP